MDKLKSIYASAHAASITIVAATILTITSELSKSFHDWLATFTGHHWVTKSWLSIIIFIVSYSLLYLTTKNVTAEKLKKSILVLQIITVLGFVIVFGFFQNEFFDL